MLLSLALSAVVEFSFAACAAVEVSFANAARSSNAFNQNMTFNFVVASLRKLFPLLGNNEVWK